MEILNENDKKDKNEQAVDGREVIEELLEREPDTTGVEIHMDGDAAEVTAVDGDYGAEQIQILEGLEAVRKRPG
ncbi:MAG: DNA topoisomerase IV subunit B, partial [Selenomonadaceae bacterium]|nr:DNA topoisomerase IV subunit B [Selenomonadaceae bacterium]